MLFRSLYRGILLLAGCPVLFSATFSPDRILSEPPPRRVWIAAKPSLPGFADGRMMLEIVVAPDAVPVVRYAAAELEHYLKRALGVGIPVVPEPDPVRTSLILGDTAWSRAAGLTVAEMPLDGFFIKTRGNSIYLGGIDDPEADPGKATNENLFLPHGTLIAVYDFLERFAGARFYFPGENGTVIPAVSSMEFPEMDILDRPDLPRRSFALHLQSQSPGEKLNSEDLARYQFQLRSAGFRIPDQGGMASLNITKRWAEKHPEILGIDESGKRVEPTAPPRQLRFCFAAEFLRENLYLDAEAFLTGKAASARGLERWDPLSFQPGFFNLSPGESCQACYCSSCQIFYRSRPESERYWGFIAEIAGKLKKNGIPGYVTLCSDGDYAHLPQIALPDNILVAVPAENPWAQNSIRPPRLDEQLVFWKNAFKRKVWLSVRISNGQRDLSFLPATTPVAIGNYISQRSSLLSGIHFLTRNPPWPHLYLNCYVASKCSWNTSLKAEQLLQEHHQLMFGPGAPAMGRFFNIIETLRLTMLKTENALPPARKIPENLWRSIYTPAQIDQLRNCFAEAETATENAPEHQKKVAYFREAFLVPLEKAAANPQQ